MRLIGGRNGVLAHNTLRGGLIEFFHGPWRIEDNDFQGTSPGTFSYAVFAAHDPIEVVIRGNRTHRVVPGGKTWRFLVLVGSGYHDVVERNVIEHLGARNMIRSPGCNARKCIRQKRIT